MFSKNKKNEKEDLVATRDLEKENNELYSKLTNKNQDYFFQLDSRLDELSYEPSKKEVVFNQMLQETTKFQKDSITAGRFYGTVTKRADKILGLDVDSFESESETSPPLHLYLDGALLLGGVFSVVNGISAWRSPEVNVNLLQLIMNFLLGGLVVFSLIKYRPEPGQTKGMFKYILATVITMVAWIFVMTFIEMLPPSIINPILPNIIVVGVGLVGVLTRFYLKKKLNIKGTIF